MSADQPAPVMAGDTMRQVRQHRGLSVNEMGDLLGLAGRGRAVRKYEEGQREITGPVAHLVLAIAEGWRPPWPDMPLAVRVGMALATGDLVERAREQADRDAERLLNGDGTDIAGGILGQANPA